MAVLIYPFSSGTRYILFFAFKRRSFRSVSIRDTAHFGVNEIEKMMISQALTPTLSHINADSYEQ